MPPTGTKGSPAWALHTAHVEAHQSRFWIEPGLKGQGISTDTLVPVQEPGLKALTNRDYRPFFYQWRRPSDRRSVCVIAGALSVSSTWRAFRACPSLPISAPYMNQIWGLWGCQLVRTFGPGTGTLVGCVFSDQAARPGAWGGYGVRL